MLHPGSHRGAGAEEGLDRARRARWTRSPAAPRDGASRSPSRTRPEPVTSSGSRAEELGAIFARVRRPERLALCLDTCHLFAAGYDIRTPRRFAAVLAEFDRAVGLGRLVAFHLNDSKAGLGSKLDRHENIGAGRIGLAAFRFLLDHPRLGALPMILETPKRDDGDARNLAALRGLRRRPRPRR